jgi:ABC-type antimicrobial peptide transport system permease subunit
MESMIGASLAQRRLSLTLLGAFGLLAIVLASLGIYGVLAYLVAERTREIGIRRALGALDGQVVRMVVGQGMALTAAGLIIGAAIAIGATRAMRGMLYGVGTTDPLTFFLVAALVAAVALLASWLPARRAARVHPMEALRAE